MPSSADYKRFHRKRHKERGGKELRVELSREASFALDILQELCNASQTALINVAIVAICQEHSHIVAGVSEGQRVPVPVNATARTGKP